MTTRRRPDVETWRVAAVLCSEGKIQFMTTIEAPSASGCMDPNNDAAAAGGAGVCSAIDRSTGERQITELHSFVSGYVALTINRQLSSAVYPEKPRFSEHLGVLHHTERQFQRIEHTNNPSAPRPLSKVARSTQRHINNT